LTEFECTNNQLTSLDVTKNTKLIHLHCYKNQLQSLDVSKENTALIDLSCYSNQINKEAMDHFINNLPQQEDAYLCVIAPDSSEGNVCTKTQVSSAKEKGWNVYAHIDYKDVEYEGSDPIENDIIINEENFPDEIFRAYLLEQSYGRDGVITAEEINNIYSLRVVGEQADERGQIGSLEGIEYFTKLTELDCHNNRIDNLDVSKNVELVTLNCSHNYLGSLDISKNVGLITLDCSDNSFASLDVSKNTALKSLSCSGNPLSSLDCSMNISLANLTIEKTLLRSLDISKNIALKSLSCAMNYLSSLDVSNNTELQRLYCYENQLVNLDVSKNIELTELNCCWNQLIRLDISNNANLNELYLWGNKINEESMDVLVKGLPQRTPNSPAQIGVVDLLNADEEGNICTIAQVAIAEEKGWKVIALLDYDNWVDYEGSAPSDIQRIILDKDTNASVYDINGRKLAEPRKGLNIIRMGDGTIRKVMVK
jgi:hypothetical protein